MSEAAPPTLFLLSFLAGTAWQWERVRKALPAVRCVPVDLPGFGDGAGVEGYSVASMADHVAAAKRAAGPGRWAIVGHSMGAKVGAVLARRAEAGEPGLEGLSHLVFLAGSPPGPEPMDDSKRAAMLAWFRGDPAQRRRDAEAYVEANAGLPLEPALQARLTDEILRANPAAWRAWLESGSREDWSNALGPLHTPTLLISGDADQALGPDAQARLMAPFFSDVRMAVLPGAKHLLPLERADDVAALIGVHLERHPAGPDRQSDDARPGHEPQPDPAGPVHPTLLDRVPDSFSASPATQSGPHRSDQALSPSANVDPDYLRFIASARVSANTRAALLGRIADPTPSVLPPTLLAVLRAVVDRVLPQPSGDALDLAARIDASLAGPGDGWLFDALPADADAYRAALTALDGFAAMGAAAQDATLAAIADGSWQGALPARLMSLWFQDLRAACVRAYVSHPAALARIGYSGIGYGGDEERKPGFSRIGLGEREPWEPEPAR